MRIALLAALLTLAACAPAAPPVSAEPARPAPPKDRSPIALTYLGVAGFQIDAGALTLLADPYFSRPDLEQVVEPDAAAIRAHAPPRADLIVISHAHVDHVLDAPALSLLTGAQVMGNLSTARIAKQSGVPNDHVITIKGGEDFAMKGYSVRVIPSLHSAISDKHAFGGEVPEAPALPMRFADYEEGGTLGYLLRVARHEVLFLGTAGFIEREVEGLRPDIAIVATGLRHEVYDYTCRLMRALGEPPVVIANHLDDWRGPPVDAPLTDDLRAFIAEVAACSPKTRVLVPKHFERVLFP